MRGPHRNRFALATLDRSNLQPGPQWTWDRVLINDMAYSSLM
jgi:hypothetical protein